MGERNGWRVGAWEKETAVLKLAKTEEGASELLVVFVSLQLALGLSGGLIM